MGLNRTARGIVLVPSLLLGGAFLAAASWGDGAAAENRGLALTLGAILMGAGLLTQLLPESAESQQETADDDGRSQPRPRQGERRQS
ncbi:MAG: GIVxVP protein [Cyanobium sp.]